MSNLTSCPRCYREARESFSSNWFPVYTCRKCGEKNCTECGAGDGAVCPECDSTSYSDYDKVYAE